MARGRRQIPAVAGSETAPPRGLAPRQRLEWPEPQSTRLPKRHGRLIDFEVVTGRAQVRELTQMVRSARLVALDIETAQHRGYGLLESAPRTIQIGFDEEGFGRRQFIADAFGDDLSPLVTALARPSLIKVIHYSAYEQERIGFHFGRLLPSVFDTCKAWQVIQRHRREGDPTYEPHDNKLATIIEKLSGTQLDKEAQGSDWGQEVLTDEQLYYAAMDVALLPPLAFMTREIARKEGCLAEVDSEGQKVLAQVRRRLDYQRRARDESPRVAEMLRRARDRDELDRIWELSRQVSVGHHNRQGLKDILRERREQLRLAG